jgi:hypothetical protein
LRQTFDGLFRVVGECYIQGMMDGEPLLGEFPSLWKIQPSGNSDSSLDPIFWNSGTNTISQEDPRLGDLSEEWDRIEHDEWRADEPFYISKHRNKLTGDLINSDPRMLPEALMARGVKLEKFRLV